MLTSRIKCVGQVVVFLSASCLSSVTYGQTEQGARDALEVALRVLRPDLDAARFSIELRGQGNGFSATQDGLLVEVDWPGKRPVLFLDSDAQLDHSDTEAEAFSTSPGAREARLRAMGTGLGLELDSWDFEESPSADTKGTAEIVACRLAESRLGTRTIGGNVMEAGLDQGSGRLVQLMLVLNRSYRADPLRPLPLDSALAIARKTVERESGRVQSRLGARGMASFRWPGDGVVRDHATLVHALPKETAWTSPEAKNFSRLEIRQAWLMTGENWNLAVDTETGTVLFGAVENKAGSDAAIGPDRIRPEARQANPPVAVAVVLAGLFVGTSAVFWLRRRKA